MQGEVAIRDRLQAVCESFDIMRSSGLPSAPTLQADQNMASVKISNLVGANQRSSSTRCRREVRLIRDKHGLECAAILGGDE